MIRLLVSLMIIVPVLAGCAGPIETRINSSMDLPLPAQTGFTFSQVATTKNPLQKLVHDLIGETLVGKGLHPADDGRLLVHASVSNGPADMTIIIGEKDGTEQIAKPKKRRLLQSCEDQEHRLKISIFDKNDGSQIYSGTATEYHCKGTIEQSLPHLTRAALINLRDMPDNDKNITLKLRVGRD